MSRFHVDPQEKIDIYEFESETTLSTTPPNIITIRARMDVATAGKVSSELMKLGSDNAPELHVGDHIGALLIHNILSWRGPDFEGLPCTPANIRMLPSPESDPFIQKVVEEITNRNRKRESPNASKAMDNGFANAGDPALTMNGRDADRALLMPSDNGTYTSPLRSAITGRRKNSED